MSESEFAINLNTGRLIKKSTAQYKKLKKLQRVREIQEVEQNNADVPVEAECAKEEAIEEAVTAPKPLPEYNDLKFKTAMSNAMADVIKENEAKFKNISQKQSDRLLKQLLYEKLCINESKPSKSKSKPAKKKGKKKFKIKALPSSSEESSESESDSDSE